MSFGASFTKAGEGGVNVLAPFTKGRERVAIDRAPFTKALERSVIDRASFTKDDARCAIVGESFTSAGAGERRAMAWARLAASASAVASATEALQRLGRASA